VTERSGDGGRRAAATVVPGSSSTAVIDVLLACPPTRKRIVANAWLMRHRRIPVIQGLAVASRAAPTEFDV
jgi:hypothetical protein